MDLIKEKGGDVSYYDPYVPVVRPTREHPHWEGHTSVAWTRETISQFDAAIIVTAHANVNYQELVAWSQIVVDTRNATKHLVPSPPTSQPPNP